MVCGRCIMVVKSELDKLRLNYSSIELGETEIMGDLSTEQMNCLKVVLKTAGLEVIEDKKSILAGKIRTIIMELIHYNEEQSKIKLTDYLSKKLNYSYPYLSNIFSEVNGTTIEKFCLDQKLERVKELLVYDELSLTEIAWKLNYNSVSHLSNQFKKKTGLSPTHFKNLKYKNLSPLGDV